MTFEEAFWKVFEVGMKPATAAKFLDQMQIYRKGNRRKARRAMQNTFLENQFKRSDLYKTVLSSVRADPLTYISALEKITDEKISEFKFWMDKGSYGSYGFYSSYPSDDQRSFRFGYNLWVEIRGIIRGLIQ